MQPKASRAISPRTIDDEKIAKVLRLTLGGRWKASRQDWIAERLHLNSASNVSQRVRQHRLHDPAEKFRAMRAWEKRFAE